jgi:peptide/nickel transport system substrate-binding protein
MPEPWVEEMGSSHTRRAFLGGTLATGLAVALPGCLGDDSDNRASTAAKTAARRGGRLRVGHVGGGTNETLMPHNPVAYIDAARAQNLYDGLTAFGPTNQLEYRLAESMEPNARGDVWQIKLRRGVTFHDGKPFTADDVLYTWRYMLDPDNVDYMAAQVTGILDLERTRKVGSHEILCQLEYPLGYLPELIALPWQMAIFPDGITTKELESKPNGTGPFKFESWTPGRRSLFTKNPDYWVSEKPYLDELEMISIPDSGARLNALLGGQIDMLESPALTQVKAQEGNDALQVQRTE